MGKTKYLKEVQVLLMKSPLVTYSSIERIVKHQKKIKGYTKLLVHHLLKKGIMKKLTKGCYTSTNNAALAVLCFQNAYLGLQDALSLHNLWEQETIPVIITSQHVRTGIRDCMHSNILIRKLDKKYFFGIAYYQQDSIALPYSDLEKTFIDMIYFKENMNKEVLENFKEKINKKKIEKYLKKYPLKIRKKAQSLLQSKF